MNRFFFYFKRSLLHRPGSQIFKDWFKLGIIFPAPSQTFMNLHIAISSRSCSVNLQSIPLSNDLDSM